MRYQLIQIMISTGKSVIMVFGLVSLIMVVLSFTPLPYWAYYNLGTENDTIQQQPQYIVLLGSNGMPSPDGLIKCYYTAREYKKYGNARLIIALPCDEKNKTQENLHLMLAELKLHGIDTMDILFEKKGINTYQQSLFIADLLPSSARDSTIELITQPEHLCRALLTFKKAGFHHIQGQATFEKTIEEDLLKHKPGERKTEPANLALRYNFWNYLKLEITVLREYTALTWYKIRGWI
jgi:uncharacterized SAM-binding protein YcdF (DUF218 family)